MEPINQFLKKRKKKDAVDLDPEAIKGTNRFRLILTDIKKEFTSIYPFRSTVI